MEAENQLIKGRSHGTEDKQVVVGLGLSFQFYPLILSIVVEFNNQHLEQNTPSTLYKPDVVLELLKLPHLI